MLQGKPWFLNEWSVQMAPSWMQLLIVVVVALLLFGGRGRISSIMGDMAKGLKSFRKGMNDDEAGKLDDGKTINVTPQKDAEKSKG
jgi:sec-independent protein translocase protein TatA